MREADVDACGAVEEVIQSLTYLWCVQRERGCECDVSAEAVLRLMRTIKDQSPPHRPEIMLDSGQTASRVPQQFGEAEFDDVSVQPSALVKP